MSYTSPSSGPSVSLIVTAAVGILTTSALAYAIYFDHRRRSDPAFRKSLKREGRRSQRAAQAEHEAADQQQRQTLRAMVDAAADEGVPASAEDKEQVFMTEVSEGEKLCLESGKENEAALCFFRALKVYPQPSELMGIYDKTVPKPVLDVLAEMVAYDRAVHGSGSASSNAGVDD